MSQWTHVCGCIRVDDIRLDLATTIKRRFEIGKILGRIVRWDDQNWETTLPIGSEGSIEYAIIENPDEHSAAAYTIPIWGDLRDYNNAEYIEKWFYDVCEKIDFIRGAVLNIEVELGVQKNISYPKQ